MGAQRDRRTIRWLRFKGVPSGPWRISLTLLASVAVLVFVLLESRVGHSFLSGILILLFFALPFLAIIDLISLHKWHRRGWETVDVFWVLGMIFLALVAVPVWFGAGRWIRARELERAPTGIYEYQR